MKCSYKNLETTTISGKLDTKSNIECLILPSKNYDNKQNFIVSANNTVHGYEIILSKNVPNTILIDSIKPNFFCVINTLQIQSDGFIEFTNNKTNLQLIKINYLNENITLKSNNIGNLCFNSNEYRFSLDKSMEINIKKLTYSGNPKIYIYGDYINCSDKTQTIKNVYIYFEYFNNSNNLPKLKLPFIIGSNSSKTYFIHKNHHGYEYILNKYDLNTISVEFKPSDIFLTIIDIKNNNNDKKILNFSENIIKNESKNLNCYQVNFWIASLNLLSLKSIETAKGPYKLIYFYGQPKIVLYIVPENNKQCNIYVDLIYN